jgi:hypothetical protein
MMGRGRRGRAGLLGFACLVPLVGQGGKCDQRRGERGTPRVEGVLLPFVPIASLLIELDARRVLIRLNALACTW